MVGSCKKNSQGKCFGCREDGARTSECIGSLQVLSHPLSFMILDSDGWDRTSQVCATAQILLDPYYRTIEGLCVLIEKDWCSFGHKFHDRIGHGDPNTESSERSPVFIQWLDVLHQLLSQFPNQFQFQESLLIFLADAVYSCLFGTFLGNCEKEREVGSILPSSSSDVSICGCSLICIVNQEQNLCGPMSCFMPPAGPTLPMKSILDHFGPPQLQGILNFGIATSFVGNLKCIQGSPQVLPPSRPSSSWCVLGMKWEDDWGTKILTESQQDAAVQNMKPIQINQHDNSSDSNISRPISVARGRLPLDFTSRERDVSLPPPPTGAGHLSAIEERNENGDDVIHRRQSRLYSV